MADRLEHAYTLTSGVLDQSWSTSELLEAVWREGRTKVQQAAAAEGVALGPIHLQMIVTARVTDGDPT